MSKVPEKLVRETQAVIGRTADVLKKAQAEKKTVGEALVDMAQAFMTPDDPERLFIEWFYNNARKRNLQAACDDLGIEMPAEGKNFYRRLKALAMPILKERYDAANKRRDVAGRPTGRNQR
jgi:hypothetical protein